jgi:hypothetical protein
MSPANLSTSKEIPIHPAAISQGLLSLGFGTPRSSCLEFVF